MMMMRQQPVVDNFYWQPLPVLICDDNDEDDDADDVMMMMMRQQPVVNNFDWQPLPVLILAFVKLAAKKLQQQI